jgi:hypothetical protein
MTKKRKQLLALWGTIILLLIFVGSLSNLVLAERSADTAGFSVVRPDGSVNPMPLIILGLTLFTLLVLVRWRQLNQRIPYLAPLIILFFGVIFVSLILYTESREPLPFVGSETVPSVPASSSVVDGSGSPLPEADGEVVEVEMNPTWLAWVSLIVSFGVALIFLALIVALTWLFFNTRPDEVPVEVDEPLTQLAGQAEAAIKALHQGQAINEVVLRCYVDMEQTLAITQGVQRRQTMTAREFEQQLIQLGLPAHPVQELTRLFETVRYGFYTPQTDDEARAINSLTAIVAACQPMAAVGAEAGQT